MNRIVPFALLVSLAACGGGGGGGGAGGGSTTPNDQFEDRPTVGEHCVARYARADDLTVIGRVVGESGLAMVAVPGDGWTVDCSSAQEALITATNVATFRVMTMVLDEAATGPLDVQAYATWHAGVMRESYAAQGLDLVSTDPLVVGTGYYIATHATGPSAPFFQLSAFQVISTPTGVLRMHLSEFGESNEVLEQHADLLETMSRTFRLETVEEAP